MQITEYGMPKEQLAALAPLLLPVGIALPVLVGKWTAGPRSLSYYMWGLFAKLCMLPLWALVLALTLKVFARPHGGGEESASVETPEETLAVSDNGVGASGPVIPLWFYVVLYAVSTLWDVAGQVMFVSQMSFFAKISDPSIGGTYMTFLNTIANAGGTLSRPFALTLLERLSLPSSRFWDSRCVEEATGKGVASSAFGLFWASLTHRLSAWWRGEGTGGGAGLLSSECEGEIDGFFVELAVLAGFGWIWLLFFWPVVFSLQELPETSWRVARKTSE
uniref:Major facilitator superfamily associated domain-containing protein n=1 Tax=Chromera velia CCMP2878 TaxID=1169474 RepID=A0A0G4GMN0_9ALVE|eukprot:Cvel_22578.t1-p1 / transcript=Cvel_22578.t1 / gene=Cvel_22578 / organism=Chromera_velia_CCMP2878 / gene_product=Acetyl-coenzyme A transporter 1, putative / transcript_product=Acetyl-coenzyme A transporter 1, putative / location=Cvel_scaffold2232:163-2841(+) / protein_length=276 / sequence_SO=supercontig / SO=protein_coding / is_pseudo=false